MRVSEIMYSDYERLKDLDDKESKKIVKQVMDYLDSQNGSTTLAVMCKSMNLPSLLVEDIIELLIIKGWLIIPEDEV